jgi:hypothetical protein
MSIVLFFLFSPTPQRVRPHPLQFIHDVIKLGHQLRITTFVWMIFRRQNLAVFYVKIRVAFQAKELTPYVQPVNRQ